MSTYHNPPTAVAAASAPDTQHDAFMHDVQSVARQLYLSTPDASADDRMFLQDVARGRYGFRALERMIRIGQASRRPEHRAAVIELAERWSNPAGELPRSLYEAFNEETLVNGEADMDQRAFEHYPTRASRERVLASLSRQVTATRRAIRAVMATALR